MNLSGFSGKRALVTGGSRGIGLEISRALYKAGCHVVVLARDKKTLEDVKKEMPNIETLSVDVADWNATKTAVSSVLPIQLLVNNAGIAMKKTFGEYEEKDVDLVYSINVKSVVNISQVVANDLKSREMTGAIVNISSIASVRPFPGTAVYGSSKAGLNGLMSVMTLELAPTIRVNSICPTGVMTDMSRQWLNDPNFGGPMLARTPLNRFAEVGDVANAAMFLLSDEGSYLNGVILPVDGGLTRI